MNNEQKLGSIIMHIGCMYSGKTNGLIDEIDRCKTFKIPYLAVKLPGDDRYSVESKIVTLVGRTTEAVTMTLEEVDHHLVDHPQVKIVLIDEAQFREGIDIYVQRWKLAGITVHLSGLQSTFQIKMFPVIIDLIPHIDEFRKHYAACCMWADCREKATYNVRLDPTSTVLKDLGGTDKYASVCLLHLHTFAERNE